MGPRQKKRTKSVLFFPFFCAGESFAIHPPLHSALIEIYRSFQFRSSLYLSKLHFNEWDALGKSLSNPTKHSNKHHSSSVINCRLKLARALFTASFGGFYIDSGMEGPDLIRFTFFFGWNFQCFCTNMVLLTSTAHNCTVSTFSYLKSYIRNKL